MLQLLFKEFIMSAESYPTISVDRAVGHYYEDVNVDPEAIARFYEPIPIDAKPPLSGCHIHVSGLAQAISRHAIGYGVSYDKQERALKRDPLGPPTDISIFAGSFAVGNPSETLTPSSVLAHELTHFAQPRQTRVINDTDRSREQKELELRLRKGCLVPGFIAKAALVGYVEYVAMNEITGYRNPLLAGVVGVGAAALANLITRRRRARDNYKLEKEIFDLDRAQVREQEAHLHSEEVDGLLEFGAQKDFDTRQVPFQTEHGKVSNKLGIVTHKQLIFTPVR
jgi:hypothetical protein